MEGTGVDPAPAAPHVSVIITAFRRQQYVRDAVESVLASDVDRSRYEIVLVTDGMKRELESELVARGVRVVRCEASAVGEMLVRGISEARGEVVSFLDDDDCMHPSKLGHVGEVFLDPAVLYYHHGFRRVDENRRPLPVSREIQPVLARFRVPLSPGAAGWIRRKGGFYNMSSIVVRREALLRSLETLRRVTNAQDFSILLLIEGPGLAVIDGTRALVDFRTHLSQGTHPFESHGLVPEHVRFLEGTVRSFEWLERTVPTREARRFAHCRVESYATLLWTTTARNLTGRGHPRFRALRAILGNLRELDARSAAVLTFLFCLSVISRQWALRFYIPLKRIELRSQGVALSTQHPEPAVMG